MKVRNLRVELRRNRGLKTAPRSQLDRGHPKDMVADAILRGRMWREQTTLENAKGKKTL